MSGCCRAPQICPRDIPPAAESIVSQWLRRWCPFPGNGPNGRALPCSRSCPFLAPACWVTDWSMWVLKAWLAPFPQFEMLKATAASGLPELHCIHITAQLLPLPNPAVFTPRGVEPKNVPQWTSCMQIPASEFLCREHWMPNESGKQHLSGLRGGPAHIKGEGRFLTTSLPWNSLENTVFPGALIE